LSDEELVVKYKRKWYENEHIKFYAIPREAAKRGTTHMADLVGIRCECGEPMAMRLTLSTRTPNYHRIIANCKRGNCGCLRWVDQLYREGVPLVLKLTDNPNTDEYFQLGMDWICKHQAKKEKVKIVENEASSSMTSNEVRTNERESEQAKVQMVNRALANVTETTSRVNGSMEKGGSFQEAVDEARHAVCKLLDAFCAVNEEEVGARKVNDTQPELIQEGELVGMEADDQQSMEEDRHETVTHQDTPYPKQSEIESGDEELDGLNEGTPMIGPLEDDVKIGRECLAPDDRYYKVLVERLNRVESANSFLLIRVEELERRLQQFPPMTG